MHEKGYNRVVSIASRHGITTQRRRLKEDVDNAINLRLKYQLQGYEQLLAKQNVTETKRFGLD